MAQAEFKRVPIDTLHEDPANARKHPERNRSAVRSSLAEFGQVEALVVQKGTGRVIGGNARLGEMRALGVEEVMVAEVDLQGIDATRLGLILNRSAETAEWDIDTLAGLLKSLDDEDALEGLGWDDSELETLLADVEPAIEPSEGDDDAPEPDSGPPDSQPGEVYELGPHRLVCGDCRDAGTVLLLAAGRKVNVAFTSPPYASQRKYDESSGFKPIPADEYVEWFEAVQGAVRQVLAADGSWFVNIKEHCEDGQRHLYVKKLTIRMVEGWGWRFVDEFCWNHKGLPGAWPNRFKNAWEPVFHFSQENTIRFRPKSVAHESENCFSEGGRVSDTNQSGNVGWSSGSGIDYHPGRALPGNVLSIHGGSDGGHSAAFPVALPSFFVRAYSDPGDVIFDPFMGSGTTMIAAALHGRVALGCEINPRYCDVIRRRWTRWAKEHGKDPGPGALE